MEDIMNYILLFILGVSLGFVVTEIHASSKRLSLELKIIELEFDNKLLEIIHNPYKAIGNQKKDGGVIK